MRRGTEGGPWTHMGRLLAKRGGCPGNEAARQAQVLRRDQDLHLVVLNRRCGFRVKPFRLMDDRQLTQHRQHRCRGRQEAKPMKGAVLPAHHYGMPASTCLGKPGSYGPGPVIFRASRLRFKTAPRA